MTITHFFCDEFIEKVEEILGALAKVSKNFELAIKPHPSFDRKLLQRIVSRYSNVTVADDSIYRLIQRFDVFLSFLHHYHSSPFSGRKALPRD